MPALAQVGLVPDVIAMEIVGALAELTDIVMALEAGEPEQVVITQVITSPFAGVDKV